mgnify:CR=1 FL=1
MKWHTVRKRALTWLLEAMRIPTAETGIFGIFDGKTLQSAVAIRFISQLDEKFYFHSGGGITIHSNVQDEYEELLEKVYLPIEGAD